MNRAFERYFVMSWPALRICLLLALPSVCAGPAQAQDGVMELAVEDLRPVAEAMRTLSTRHGAVITYEDPVRPGIPVATELRAFYSVMPGTNAPSDAYAAIEAILDAAEAASRPERFRIERAGEVFHVIPTQAREPILDTRISFEVKELVGRSALDVLELICDELSASGDTRVALGNVPFSVLRRARFAAGARDERARDVLRAVLQSVDPDLTWRLLYNSQIDWYVLNIAAVAGSR